MKIIKEKWNRATDKPYHMCLRIVCDDLRISADAFRLYLTLLNCNTDPKNGKVFEPTEASLATQFKVTEKTVQRWIKELRKYGYIEISGSKSGGYFWYVNKYSKGIVDVKTKGEKHTRKSLRNITSKQTILSVKNDDGNNPLDVSKQTKMSVSKQTKMSDTIKTLAAPAKGEAANANKGTIEYNLEGVNLTLKGVTHSPSAATPSGQPTEMLHPSMGRDESVIPSMVEIKDNTPMAIGNELELIINNTKFGNIYNSNRTQWGCWKEVDISNMTNVDIANAVYQYEKGTPLKDIPNGEYNKTTNMLKFVVEYAKDIPNSEIWKEYERLKKIKPKVETVNTNASDEKNTPKVEIENGVYKYTPKRGKEIIESNPDDFDLPF